MATVAVDSDAILDYTSKIDALVDRIDALLDYQQNGKNAITVTHTQTGLGAWGAAAVTACFFSTLIVIALAIVIIPEIHDLRAWQTIFGRDISAMKQQMQQIQQEKKP